MGDTGPLASPSHSHAQQHAGHHSGASTNDYKISRMQSRNQTSGDRIRARGDAASKLLQVGGGLYLGNLFRQDLGNALGGVGEGAMNFGRYIGDELGNGLELAYETATDLEDSVASAFNSPAGMFASGVIILAMGFTVYEFYANVL